jgi:cytochrome b561
MNDSRETAFDTATRIAAGATRSTYDAASIWLHWATALLVVVQFALAQTWDWFPKPTRELMESTHASFGVVLTAVIAARLLWRLMPGHQLPSLESGWIKAASKSLHYLLYALLVAEAVLGFAVGWGRGHPLSFFGLGIPSPIEGFDRPIRRQIHELHENVAWAIIILATGHALAALYHHYVVKDRALVRMLPRGSRERVG